MKNLQKNMKALRRAKGYTQEQMAEIMRTSKVVYNYYENGSRNMSDDTLSKFAHYFNIMPGKLAEDELSDTELAALAENALPFAEYAANFMPGYVNEHDAKYSAPGDVVLTKAEAGRHIGSVIEAMMEKHRTNKGELAQYLDVTIRSLQRWVSGEQIPSVEMVVKIAEYHGESMDLFRNTILMPGHYLQRIKDLEMLVSKQEKIIKLLER